MSESNEAAVWAERYNSLVKVCEDCGNKHKTAEDFIREIVKEQKASNERIKKLHFKIENLENKIESANCIKLSKLYYELVELEESLNDSKYKNLKKDLNISAEIIFKYIPKSYLKPENT